MTAEIEEFYVLLSRQYGQEMTDVAVRSSATAEDLPMHHLQASRKLS
jgi:pyruvate,water dikinase